MRALIKNIYLYIVFLAFVSPSSCYQRERKHIEAIRLSNTYRVIQINTCENKDTTGFNPSMNNVGGSDACHKKFAVQDKVTFYLCAYQSILSIHIEFIGKYMLASCVSK